MDHLLAMEIIAKTIYIFTLLFFFLNNWQSSLSFFLFFFFLGVWGEGCGYCSKQYSLRGYSIFHGLKLKEHIIWMAWKF